MSCISKILEKKGNKDFLLSEGIAIEGGGIYKKYEYLITFVKLGHRCGYVAIPESHPLYIKSVHPDLEVHGNITYFDESRFEDLTDSNKCNDKWIGFDAGHYFDYPCIETAKKYFGEQHYGFIENNADPKNKRSYEYMENECKKLINQLIKVQL